MATFAAAVAGAAFGSAATLSVNSEASAGDGHGVGLQAGGEAVDLDRDRLLERPLADDLAFELDRRPGLEVDRGRRKLTGRGPDHVQRQGRASSVGSVPASLPLATRAIDISPSGTSVVVFT